MKRVIFTTAVFASIFFLYQLSGRCAESEHSAEINTAIFKSAATAKLEYAYLNPANPSENPYGNRRLILAFHAAGHNGAMVLANLRQAAEKSGSVVIAPTRKGSFFYSRENFAVYKDLLDQKIQTLEIDPDRIYLVGVSIGAAYARQFAMLFPEYRWRGLILVSAPPPQMQWIRKVPPSFPSIFYIMGAEDSFYQKSLFDDGFAGLRLKNISADIYLDPNAGHTVIPEWDRRIFEWINKVEKNSAGLKS